MTATREPTTTERIIDKLRAPRALAITLADGTRYLRTPEGPWRRLLRGDGFWFLRPSSNGISARQRRKARKDAGRRARGTWKSAEER